MRTRRLVLRPTRLADAPALFRFLGDAHAMRHTHADASLGACRRRIAAHERRRRHDGFAPWTVLDREEGRILGWGGIFVDPFEAGWGPEVGYWFDPAAWGRGYASELVQAATAHADRDLRLPMLVAFARPQNPGSQRVLEKAGFMAIDYIAALQRLRYRRLRQSA